jgi:hypothetical protein
VKSLKEFGLNLKGKDCFKKELEKKKEKENLPFTYSAQQPIYPIPQRPVIRLSFFFFSADADTWAPPVSLPFPFPFFFFSPLPSRPDAVA